MKVTLTEEERRYILTAIAKSRVEQGELNELEEKLHAKLRK